MTDTALIAAIEPSAQLALIALLSLCVTTVGGLGIAWIAYKQAQLAKTVQTLEKNTNSMKDALMASTAKASLAEGVIQEKRDETIRKAEIVIAIGQHGSTGHPVQPVAASGLAKAIEKVPEKTATIVVEKLDEQKQTEK